MGANWASELLKGILPPGSLALLHKHIMSQNAPLQVFKHNVVAATEATASTMRPLLEPLANWLTRVLTESPDMVIIIVFLAFLAFAVQFILMIQRLIAFWTRMAIRAVIWAAVVALVAACWQRGLETTVRDGVAVASNVVGALTALWQFFWAEYHRYQEQETTKGQAQTQKSKSGWL